MKKILLLAYIACAFLALPACVHAQRMTSHLSPALHTTDRHLSRTLPSGVLIVIAEGTAEPRSIGSYSIRAYAANPEFPRDEFLVGVIRPRDGSVEQMLAQDITGDATPEIIVTMRCAGTGNYLSADAFQYHDGQLKLIATISGFEKNTDPIIALKKELQKSSAAQQEK